eukprot:scaffold20865_cov42-Phaeocystis_antarctica.AAC.1
MRLLGTAHARVRQVDFGRGQWEQCTLLQDKPAACCKFGLLRRTQRKQGCGSGCGESGQCASASAAAYGGAAARGDRARAAPCRGGRHG